MMKLFQVQPSANNVIAVEGPCYLNFIAVKAAAGSEGWAMLRDTVDTADQQDHTIKLIKEAQADRTEDSLLGENNHGAFFGKGISVQTENTSLVFLGITPAGSITVNERTS